MLSEQKKSDIASKVKTTINRHTSENVNSNLSKREASQPKDRSNVIQKENKHSLISRPASISSADNPQRNVSYHNAVIDNLLSEAEKLAQINDYNAATDKLEELRIYATKASMIDYAIIACREIEKLKENSIRACIPDGCSFESAKIAYNEYMHRLLFEAKSKEEEHYYKTALAKYVELDAYATNASNFYYATIARKKIDELRLHMNKH